MLGVVNDSLDLVGVQDVLVSGQKRDALLIGHVLHGRLQVGLCPEEVLRIHFGSNLGVRAPSLWRTSGCVWRSHPSWGACPVHSRARWAC